MPYNRRCPSEHHIGSIGLHHIIPRRNLMCRIWHCPDLIRDIWYDIIFHNAQIVGILQ